VPGKLYKLNNNQTFAYIPAELRCQADFHRCPGARNG
jgi:hypothetical protein